MLFSKKISSFLMAATMSLLLSTSTWAADGTSDSSKKNKCRRFKSKPLCRRKTKTTDTPSERRRRRLPVCVGIRGNGPRLWAHFPALARVVEALGPINGMAGGSSGSLTSFFVESIESNPLVYECGGPNRCCDEETQKARISFLLKSLQGLQEEEELAVLGNPNILLEGLTTDPTVVLSITRIINGQGTEGDVQVILDAVRASPVNIFINPDVITLLETSTDPVKHATDIFNATLSTTSFAATDPEIFIRPYLISFPALADVFGIVGSFYAGLSPLNLTEMESILDQCAVPGLGHEWTEIDSQPTQTSTCGDDMRALFNQYTSARDSMSHPPSQLDQPLGQTVSTLITTSILQGDSKDLWETALVEYMNLNFPPVPFTPSFEDFRVGYFGDKKSLRKVSKRLPMLFDDIKSQKFLSLGEQTWRDVLIRSPAEPTLSRGVRIGTNLVSLGGWTDPVPSQVLAAMGCEKSVLINRPDGIGSFSTGVATLLGATDDDLDALYELGNPDSAFEESLEVAEATICADWDAPDGSDVDELAQSGYDALFLSNDSCILSLDVGAVADQDVFGCTPLAS